MGLFSLFSKRKPEEIYRSIAQKIVVSALSYIQEIDAPDNKRSADAGAELMYLLLHLVDRQAFGQLGATQRDAVVDEVSQIAVADYAGVIYKANTPQDLIISGAEQMISTLNSRQTIYAQCESLNGEWFPCKGTMIFALSFFVHRALGNTDRTDAEEILSGKTEISESDIDDFPDSREITKTAIIVNSMLNALKIQKELKCLQ